MLYQEIIIASYITRQGIQYRSLVNGYVPTNSQVNLFNFPLLLLGSDMHCVWELSIPPYSEVI